jgi:CheY-like chemotaxis protein
MGHEVSVAGNGKDAVIASTNESFDLILMDVQMPEMDGLDATRSIRKHEEATGKHVPIVAMTAHVMKGDREIALEAGMDGYITKPIDGSELFETIEGLAETVGPEKRSHSEEFQCPEILDYNELLARMDGDKALLLEMVELFLDDCPALLDHIREALRDQDAEKLHNAAHALKGSAANFIARKVVEVAQDMEMLGRQQNLNAAQHLLTLLEQRLQDLCEALESIAKEAA